MSIKVYTNLLKLLPVVSLLWATGCTDETDNPHSSTELSDEPVMVYAGTVATGVATRSGDTGSWVGENTPIKDRTMLFTYPSQPYGEMKSAYCVFDGNGIGYVYADMMNYPDCKQRLRWKDILTGAASYPGDAVDAVFLDNLVNYPVENKTWPVPGQAGKDFNINFFTRILSCKEQPKSLLVPNAIAHGQDPATAFVKEENDQPHQSYRFRQMIAPIGHKEAEEVDIIWGKIDKPTPNKSLNFKLEHQMSAISFRFYTEDEKLEDQLKGAKEVWMDEVRIWLDDRNIDGTYYNDALYSSFNRKAGFVYGRSDLYRENQTANGLYLVQAGNMDKRPEQLLVEQPGDGTTYYSTPMWIVPPYKWRAGGKLPKVSLRLENNTVYTGRLPEKPSYWEQTPPHFEDGMLRFWKGYHITFKVRLISDNDEFELLFESVTVSPFTSWGKFDDPTLAESGIYSGEDLDNLTKTYNANSDSDNYRLLRYGRHDGEKWFFPLWRRIDIPMDQPLPQFKNGQFEIVENSYGIYHGINKVKIDDLIAKQ